MRGSFSNYTLSQVLNVANIGNQYIGIELINSNSEDQGTIIIKDSQVLVIKIGNTSGYEAVEKISDEPLTQFRVFIIKELDFPPKPIGSVSQLHAAIKKLSAAPDAVKSTSKNQLNSEVDKSNLSTPSEPLTSDRHNVEMEVGDATDSANMNEGKADIVHSDSILEESTVRMSLKNFRIWLSLIFNKKKESDVQLEDKNDSISEEAFYGVEEELDDQAGPSENSEEEKTDIGPREAFSEPSIERENEETERLNEGKEDSIETAKEDDEIIDDSNELSEETDEVKDNSSDAAVEAEEDSNELDSANETAPSITDDLKNEKMTASVQPPGIQAEVEEWGSTDRIGLDNRTEDQFKPATQGSENGLILAIASSKGGVGKTTVAINLSVSLARQGLRTVLVDGDPNGDVLAAIKVNSKSAGGAYDAIFNSVDPSGYLLQTAIPELMILPAVNDFSLLNKDGFDNISMASWRKLFDHLSDFDIIIVDTSAGIYGPSVPIIKVCTHIIGVLQTEAIAYRSFSNFVNQIKNLPEDQRPTVSGILLNMFQENEKSSVDILQSAKQRFSFDQLFETVLSWDSVYLRSSSSGVPLYFLDKKSPPLSASYFDALAREVSSRLWEREEDEEPVSFM